jgi:hypothetical protein
MYIAAVVVFSWRRRMVYLLLHQDEKRITDHISPEKGKW